LVGSHSNGSSVARQLITQLRDWRTLNPSQAALRDDYLAFLTEPTALDRDAGRAHVTASCFIFSESFSAILLCFHKKGQFWVQPGGHIEITDGSVCAAAFREALEETGIVVTPLSEWPQDVDRHSLDAGFSRCDVHWDVGFVGTADETQSPVTSHESEDVRWWPVNALPHQVPTGFARRVERLVASAAALI
jgi:8-oxo-dGTP pyrophosphatase MutT (NUDIX family)